MITIDRQVHGYKQGHQLLASSVVLPKADQSIVDRLSDVAGPLRPGEIFAPYISAYPLPSGERFVLAKTWQDLTVARAGCVKTLSLVVSASDWGKARTLSPFFDILNLPLLPQETDATKMILPNTGRPLLQVENLPADLIEALFLEEPQPVAVFDSKDSELITLRLLTALWPSLRKKFAVSTFALSPRKVDGRDFNLVFSPKDARSRFSDWSGRRVDGRSSKDARHRWTNEIASRIFLREEPQLLLQNEVEIFGEDDTDEANATKLRLALMWRELFFKISTTPAAALGLLDIANSGKLHDRTAFKTLEPYLHDAIKQAPLSLAEDETWSFLIAIVRKTEKYSLNDVTLAVADVAEDLASVAPEGALALLSSVRNDVILLTLLPRIAEGLGSNFTPRVENALLNAPEDLLGQLVIQQDKLAIKIASNDRFIARVADILPHLDEFSLDKLSKRLLPILVDDFQAAVAAPLIRRLDASGLVEEIKNLGKVNNFKAKKIFELALSRTLQIGAQLAVRSCLVLLSPTSRRDRFLAELLMPSIEDVAWLINNPQLTENSIASIFAVTIKKATARQVVDIASSSLIGDKALQLLVGNERNILERAIYAEKLSVRTLSRLISALLYDKKYPLSTELAKKALHQCLQTRLDDAGQVLLFELMSCLGGDVDIAWLSATAFGSHVDASLISRNMVVISSLEHSIRSKVCNDIVEVAKVLHDRISLDLDSKAADALSLLLMDAEENSTDSIIEASAYLLPMAINQIHSSNSPVIVATFPCIYKELARSSEAPFLFKVFNFFDWDHCKTMREQLVSAFMSSSWPSSDLVLTAWRADAVDAVVRRVFKRTGGASYLYSILAELDRLPPLCRKEVEKSICRILDYK